MSKGNAALACAIRSVGVLGVVASSGAAQLPPAAAAPVPIRDNSFLIEEAYNQEWGVVQHVGTFQRIRGSPDWGATFTQEWPAPGERHQLSFTVPVLRGSGAGAGASVGIGDIALNYRYQVPMGERSRVAFAPRLSVLVPVGDEAMGRGTGNVGVEANFPLSIELSRLVVTHFNLGAGWGRRPTPIEPSEVFIGQSLVLLIHPRFNFMVEALRTVEIGRVGLDAGSDEDDTAFLIAPGFRAAIDFPSGLQVVPGIAFPIGVGPSKGEESMYLYLSFEHPFRRR